MLPRVFQCLLILIFSSAFIKGESSQDSLIIFGINDINEFNSLDISDSIQWYFSYETPDSINSKSTLSNRIPINVLNFEELSASDKWKNYGWFETEFEVDSSLSREPLIITVHNQEAINIWLNGRLILESGRPSEDAEHEVLSRWQNPIYNGFPLKDGRNHLLIEYSAHTIPEILKRKHYNKYSLDIHVIQSMEPTTRLNRGVVFGGVMMLLILIILIHSYLTYKFKDGYHIFVTLTTLFMFIHAFTTLSDTVIEWTFTYRYFYEFSYATGFIFVIYFYLISIRKYYRLDIHWRLLNVTLLTFLTLAIYSVLAKPELINIINPTLGIPTFLYGAYSLFQAKKNSKHNSILVITLGFLVTISGALLYAFLYVALGINSIPLLLLATILAYTGVPISLTFNVAQSYAQLISTLEQKVEARTAELEASNKYKTEFFANISHEFRTPLTISEGLVNKVVDNREEDAFVKKELGVVSRNLIRLHNMVDQIIDLTKSDEGQLTLQEKNYNADDLATISVESFRSLAEYHHHCFEFHPNAVGAIIHADRAKVEIMINNLISNAIKFTPKGGNIVIKTWVEDNNYFLSVKDTGPGIPAGEEEAVFERFHRIHRSEEDYVEGMGVGLELSRSMAQLHGGNIIAKSNQEVGALFVLKLPVKDSTQQTVIDELETDTIIHSNENKQEVVSKKEKEFNLLLVEDNQDMMHYVSGILEHLGTIHTANNGVEAIEILKKITPDIIISDLMMPKMGGQKLVEHLSQHKDWENIPVVVLTAKALEEDKLNLLRIGVVDYITKPFLPEQLMLKARNLLKFYQQKTKLKVTISNEELLKVEGFKEKLAAYIFENIEDSTMTVDRLAKHFSQSRRSLYRNLQLEVGMTPAEFIREVRLTTAQTMVANNKSLRLDELARAVGYKTTVGLKRAYKERFGVYPLD